MSSSHISETYCLYDLEQIFKMFTQYLTLLLMVPAILAVKDLDTETFTGFRSTFHGLIEQHLRAEYVLLSPIMAKQNESWLSCRQSIDAKHGPCRSCVESNCGSDFTVTEMSVPEEVSVDWEEWHDIGVELFGEGEIDHFLNMAAQRTGTQSGLPNRKRFWGAAFTAISGLWASYEIGNHLVVNWDGISSTLSNIGSSVGNWVSGLFSRKRRDIGMSARHILGMMRRKIHRQMEGLGSETSCMQQCSECQYFLGEPADMVSQVCSPKMLMDQRTMVTIIKELKELYMLNGDPESSTPVLTKIEYNPENFRLSSMSFGDVYVTAMTPSGPMRYLSEYRFRIQSPETSAIEMAEELLSKWGL